MFERWTASALPKNYWPVLAASATALLSALALTVRFLPRFDQREGFVPPDPLLDVLPCADVSTATFVLLYGFIAWFVLSFLNDPKLAVRGFLSFSIMYFIRAACIWAVPFNEPSGLIELRDPFIESIGIYQKFVRRDLFFSGHVASVFIPFLLLRGRSAAPFFLAGTVAVALCVMVQRIHFSWDVLGALAFSQLAVWLADRATERLLG